MSNLNLQEHFSSMFQYLYTHPIFTFLLIFVALQIFQRTRKFPTVPGSKVIDVTSVEQLTQILKDAPKNCLVVVDFYAKWCPPCRSAAPVFSEWSKTYPENQVIFCKVDVDEARAVAQTYQIRAMPTFKFFREGKMTESLQGWRQSQILDLINNHLKVN